MQYLIITMLGTGVSPACGGEFRALLLVHIVAHVGERRRGTQVSFFLVLPYDRQQRDITGSRDLFQERDRFL